MLSKDKFISLVFSMKDKCDGPSSLTTELEKLSEFRSIVSRIDKNNTEWGEKVGILNAKKEEADNRLSQRELQWKNYFKDHAFGSAESQRNMADAISIMEGFDVNRFIRIVKDYRGKFPSYVSIVPLLQAGGHDYRIGTAIITIASGTQFFKPTGSTGNSMSTDPKTFRFSKIGEISSLLGQLFYKSNSFVENFVYSLLDDEDDTEGDDE